MIELSKTIIDPSTFGVLCYALVIF